MSMVVLKPYFWLGGDYVKTVTLPDDTMVMPIQRNVDSEYVDSFVCHSDNTEKWYIINKLSAPVPEQPEVYYYLDCSGSWVDIAPYCSIGYIYAPFKWGNPLKNKHLARVQYIPVWQSVPTGKYHETEGFELYEERYSLIRTSLPVPTDIPSDPNTTQYNEMTSFEVFDYGTDLIQMVRDIECHTGLKF